MIERVADSTCFPDPPDCRIELPPDKESSDSYKDTAKLHTHEGAYLPD